MMLVTVMPTAAKAQRKNQILIYFKICSSNSFPVEIYTLPENCTLIFDTLDKDSSCMRCYAVLTGNWLPTCLHLHFQALYEGFHTRIMEVEVFKYNSYLLVFSPQLAKFCNRSRSATRQKPFSSLGNRVSQECNNVYNVTICLSSNTTKTIQFTWKQGLTRM